MSIKVMSRVWEKSPQKGGALLALLALADWSNDYGVSWYGGKKLYKKTRLTERGVQYIIAALSKTRDLYVCQECSDLNTNVYIVTTAMSCQDIFEALTQPPLSMPKDTALILANEIDKRPVERIKTGVKKLHPVKNATKSGEKIAPNTSFNTKHHKARKRDLIFDAIAKDFLGCNLEDKSAVSLIAGHVVKVKSELLKADSTLTADELIAAAAYHRTLYNPAPGEMPSGYDSIARAILRYRNRTVQTNGQQVTFQSIDYNPADQIVFTEPDNEQ